MSDLKFNESASRYEQEVSGYTVYANIRRKDSVLYIDYVYTPSELRGQGIGSAFMSNLMGVAARENMTVKPICGFAASWLRKHEDEYKDLIAA